MTDPHLKSDEDIAARFIAQIDAGYWTESDEAKLQTWLAEKPVRQGLLLRLEAEWVALDAANAMSELVIPPTIANENEDGVVPASGWGTSRLTRRGLMAGTAASCVAGYFALHFVSAATGYETKVGEIRRLPLADGSVMTMNSGSQISVSLDRDLRQVNLVQGEAWFEVAKDARRPFVVAIGDVQVRAVGTAFSVRRRGTVVEVLVTEGVVETTAQHDKKLRLVLKAGDRALLGPSALVDYETGQSSGVDRSLAWRSGMIDLDGTPLSSAAEEFNRYNQRQIIIADPAIAAEQFDGLFRVNDPEGFAEAVKASIGVTLDTTDPGIIRMK